VLIKLEPGIHAFVRIRPHSARKVPRNDLAIFLLLNGPMQQRGIVNLFHVKQMRLVACESFGYK
jgi:hypothetical protein